MFLQKANSTVTTYRRTSNGTGALTAREDEFANPDNLPASLVYLRSSLQGKSLVIGISQDGKQNPCNLFRLKVQASK